jgi:hypothetical protein
MNVQCLYDELAAVIERHRHENILNYIELIGTLMRLIHEANLEADERLPDR